MLAGLGQIAGAVVAVSVIGGVTIAVIGKEVLINQNDTLADKAEDSLIRLGYVSEGIVKGAMVSVPPCIVALIVLNYGLKAQKSLVGGVQIPLPLILAAPAIGASVIAIAGVYYYANEAGDEWKETTVEEANNLINSGYTFLGNLGEDIGEGLEAIGAGIADLGEDVGRGTLRVIKGAGIAVIEGAEDVFDYTYNKIAPHRVEAISVLTAMLVYTTTAVIIFKKIRGAN